MFVVRRLGPMLPVSKTISTLLLVFLCLWRTRAASPLDLDQEFTLSLTNELKVQDLALAPDGQIGFAAHGTDFTFGWLDSQGTSLWPGPLGGHLQANTLILT